MPATLTRRCPPHADRRLVVAVFGEHLAAAARISPTACRACPVRRPVVVIRSPIERPVRSAEPRLPDALGLSSTTPRPTRRPARERAAAASGRSTRAPPHAVEVYRAACRCRRTATRQLQRRSRILVTGQGASRGGESCSPTGCAGRRRRRTAAQRTLVRSALTHLRSSLGSRRTGHGIAAVVWTVALGASSGESVRTRSSVPGDRRSEARSLSTLMLDVRDWSAEVEASGCRRASGRANPT